MNTAEVINFPAPRREVVKVADVEDGYTRIANELLESIASSDLTARQLKVILAVIRKTYGFCKKSDRIADSQIAEITGLSRQNVNKAKNELISMRLLFVDGNKIGINKLISCWETQSRDSVSNLKTKNVSNLETNDVSNVETHKRNILKKKEKIPLTPVGDENLALEILDYFNKLTSSKFQSTAPFLKALSTVKSKGVCYTADEIKLVVEWSVTQWRYGDKLKPENLCRMKRFDGYLSDAIRWKERTDRNPVDCPHAELINLWNAKIPDRSIDT
ncbi:replication protein, partial [Photorhabdus sp. RM323S]|uniref:replication protein n=1 Tax=Photorhabdus sp. RM323S TaxID=3342828 RepID=UPI0036DB090E